MHIDGYVLYEPVGFGSKGPIWRAVDVGGKNHALQVLGANLPSDLEHRIAKLKELNSAHVLRIEQLRKITDGRYVILSEFIEGQNLEILRAGRRLTPQQLHFVGQSLAKGLADLHDCGLLHGDVSAANAMITSHGRILWVDVLGSPEGQTQAFCEVETNLASRNSVDMSRNNTLVQSQVTEKGTAGNPNQPAAEVFAFAQLMLALGMDNSELGNALHPHPQQRPTMRELYQSWEHLPTAGIELLTPSELTCAKMRAAGRDVVTTLEKPKFEVTDSRSTRNISPSCHKKRHLEKEIQSSRSSSWLKIAIPALSGTALAFALTLTIPLFHPHFGIASQVPESDAKIPLKSSPRKIPAYETKSTPQPAAEKNDGGNTTLEGVNLIPQDLLPPAAPEPNSEADLLENGNISTDAQAVAVLQELLSRRDKAFQNGNATELEQISQPDSIIQKADRELLSRLQNSQTRITGLSTAVISAHIVDANENQIRLRATLSQGAYTQTDHVGNQRQISPLRDAAQEILLIKHPWRIASVVRLQ